MANEKIKRNETDQLELFPMSSAERKRAFLNKLKPINGKNDYKRYTGSVLRYPGGKSLAVGLVLELIPDNIERLISPFIGGGSIEVACAKELGIPVIGYDIFDILTNFWEVLLEDPETLYELLLKFEPTREGFYKAKERLKKHWKGEEKLERYELAAFYYFNYITSYGPHFLGSPSSVYLQQERYSKVTEKVRNFSAEKLEVHCGRFEDIIPQYNNDFLYCDPPYYLDGDSKTFIGLYPHRNFPIHHKDFDHVKLRDLLVAHGGGFILSYNDCSPIRELYEGFNMSTPSWQYTFSQGDTRIGENRLKNNNGSHVKKSHELIIWKLPNK